MFTSPERASEQSLLLNLLSDLGANSQTLSLEGLICKEFVKGTNAYKSLRKLRREVNEDLKEDRLDSIHALAQARAVPDHIIPLIEQHGPSDPELLLEGTKLLVQLTMPDQPSSHAVACKSALIRQPSALAVIVSQVHAPLSVDSSKRSEKHKLVLELVLWLTRNLVYCHGDDDSEFVQLLQSESVLDICLHLAEHVIHKGNREWDLVLLEIFFHLLRECTPESLAFEVPKVSPSRSENVARAAPKIDDELSRLRDEAKAKKAAMARSLATRHSRFGGMFSQRTDSGDIKLRVDLNVHKVNPLY